MGNYYSQYMKWWWKHLLAVLIYNPPLRTSYYTSSKIIRKKILNDKINNFILLSKRGKNTVKIIINKDKATNYKI